MCNGSCLIGVWAVSFTACDFLCLFVVHYEHSRSEINGLRHVEFKGIVWRVTKVLLPQLNQHGNLCWTHSLVQVNKTNYSLPNGQKNTTTRLLNSSFSFLMNKDELRRLVNSLWNTPSDEMKLKITPSWFQRKKFSNCICLIFSPICLVCSVTVHKKMLPCQVLIACPWSKAKVNVKKKAWHCVNYIDK